MPQAKTDSFDLKQIRIAKPCPSDWEKMVGDDRVRHCSLCQLNVYNVAGLTIPQAQALLDRSARGERVCLRLLKRADGTLITRDCPVGVKLLRQARLRTAALMASLVGLLMGVGWSRAQAEPLKEARVAKQLMGKVAASSVMMGAPVAPPTMGQPVAPPNDAKPYQFEDPADNSAVEMGDLAPTHQ